MIQVSKVSQKILEYLSLASDSALLHIGFELMAIHPNQNLHTLLQDQWRIVNMHFPERSNILSLTASNWPNRYFFSPSIEILSYFHFLCDTADVSNHSGPPLLLWTKQNCEIHTVLCTCLPWGESHINKIVGYLHIHPCKLW